MPATPPARSKSSAPTKPRARAAASDARGAASSTDRIAESITAAIIERRLMPGTKLAEQKIADIFKVSRTLVRQALNQLSRDKLVTLEPARGARVAEPSVEEARQVFEARQHDRRRRREARLQRRPHRRAARRAARPPARRAGRGARTDVSGRTRLLADFHVVLAAMLGNTVLAELLGDLVARSSLIALMYQSAHSAEHSYEPSTSRSSTRSSGATRAPRSG